jgi:hypothetical protein
LIDATPLLKLYAARRLRHLRAENVGESQSGQLMSLVRRAAETKFGRDHAFAQIRKVEEFQASVPLRRYEDMWREYWQSAFPMLANCTWPGTIPFFALSSGTSAGASKYIPCTEAMNRANSRAGLDVLVHHVANRRGTHVLGGKIFLLGGSTELRQLADGIYGGDLSGIAASRASGWMRRFTFPPPELALIADWEQKVAAITPAVFNENIRAIAGTPSWLLIFFEHLFALRSQLPPQLGAFFPDLELLVHGGVNFAPYRAQFDTLLQGSRAETREAYAASEGFIAVADRGPGEGLRLLTDNGLFYEFIPVGELGSAKPTRHWVKDLQTGIDYAIAVTSCAGVWSYIIGDTVRFLERSPPRLIVTGRTSYALSSFGEHLTGEDVETSVAEAAKAIGGSVSDFSVGTLFPAAERSRGGHLYVVEFSSAPPNADSAKRFIEVVDQELCRRNDDYRAHRSGGFGMDPPRLLVLRRGSFETWMKSRGKLGGQNKVPRIINDQGLFTSLRNFSAGRIVASA